MAGATDSAEATKVVEDAYSFVGAAPQGLMRSKVGPEWAEMARDLGAESRTAVDFGEPY